MAVDIIAPRLGVTVTEMKVVEWLVADGGTVADGDEVISVETDKNTQDLTAPAAGVVHHQVAVGDVCLVGSVLGQITPQQPDQGAS